MNIQFSLTLVVGTLFSATTFAESTDTEWPQIKPGTFTMGDPDYLAEETPNRENAIPHKVTLTNGFTIQPTEVTLEQWKSVMGEDKVPNGSPLCPDDCPVNTVSWLQAIQYANALSASEGLERCYVIQGRVVKWPKGYECDGYHCPPKPRNTLLVRVPPPVVWRYRCDQLDQSNSRWKNQFGGETDPK